MKLNLLPRPRFLKIKRGKCVLPASVALEFDSSVPAEIARAIADRLKTSSISFGRKARKSAPAQIRADRSKNAPAHAEGYSLKIGPGGILIEFREVGGLHAATATLRQLLREYGRTLPCLEIRDWPDIPRRGVMLDISRGRVPRLETLLELVEHLAGFKINEFQLYTEHTFAYRKYKPVWREWGALTAVEIQKLDARCRELGIELVPNQNSFGHLRCWLEYPPLKKLAEVSQPYEDSSPEFVRRPTTLAPDHPGTLPFLRGLYNELLPNFSSRRFNVGCDETWDLGRGQSKSNCQRLGKGRVYLDFLRRIQREVSRHDRQMMFWGDIILHYPELIHKLPRDVIALNWGYEADHPFDREARRFAKAKIPFYVCPGTSTWMTMVGKHDNAIVNLTRAANAARRYGAEGVLITDWGDGGHPQPLAVSYIPYLNGACASWSKRGVDGLLAVLSRDVFHDPTQEIARSAFSLGFAHQKLRCDEPNATPLGTVLAAPPPALRELYCRNGLKHFRRIAPGNIRQVLKDLDRHLAALHKGRPSSKAGKILQKELELATRMAAQSCRFMLWQQASAAGKFRLAGSLARTGTGELQQIEREFKRYWPTRNKGTTAKCSPFLQWRVMDYKTGNWHPELRRKSVSKRA